MKTKNVFDRCTLIEMTDACARFAVVEISYWLGFTKRKPKTKRRKGSFPKIDWKIVGRMYRETATRKREQRSYLVAEGQVEAISKINSASDGKGPSKFNDEDDSSSCDATRSLIRGREFLQFRAAASAGCCNKTARYAQLRRYFAIPGCLSFSSTVYIDSIVG